MDHGLESVFFAFKDKRNRDKVYATLLELGAASHLELSDLEDTTVKVILLPLSVLLGSALSLLSIFLFCVLFSGFLFFY